MKTIVITLFIIAIGIVIWEQLQEMIRKENRKLKYTELMIFKYYVNNCSLTQQSFDIILDRLKNERASDEMNDPDYLNEVNSIGLLFEERFKYTQAL
jgi:hypothetical protein